MSHYHPEDFIGVEDNPRTPVIQKDDAYTRGHTRGLHEGLRQGLLEAARLARERDHSAYDANDCRDNLNALAERLEQMAAVLG